MLSGLGQTLVLGVAAGVTSLLIRGAKCRLSALSAGCRHSVQAGIICVWSCFRRHTSDSPKSGACISACQTPKKWGARFRCNSASLLEGPEDNFGPGEGRRSAARSPRRPIASHLPASSAPAPVAAQPSPIPSEKGVGGNLAQVCLCFQRAASALR